MRKYLSYILCTLTAVVMTGCLELGVEIVEVPAVAKLQLKSTELVATRTEGNLDLNENLITQVQLFFSVDGENVKYYTKVAELDKEDGQVKNLQVTLPASALAGLFPNNTANEKCKLFVVANAPDVPEASRKTITDVKKTAIGFTKDDDGNLTTEQASFVMTGADDVTLGEDNNISGEVLLKRVAAKVEVTINLKKKITLGDKVWTPEYNNISMSFKGMTTSNVGGTESSLSSNFEQTKFKVDDNTEGDGYVITQEVPFYSYPTTWNNNSENVIILTIPWKRQDQNDYTTYKYQIPVNYDAKQLLSNYLYKLEVNVGILGTPVEEADDLVITPCSYVVIDWGTGTINAELSRPKYLVVDETYVELFNQTTYQIDYHSSDEVNVILDSIKFYNYQYANTRSIKITKDETTITPAKAGLSVTDKFADYSVTYQQKQDSNDGSLTFTHKVPTNYVPHYIYLTVQHNQAGTSFKENVVIVQYPPIYIKADPSNGKVYINETQHSGDQNYPTVYDDDGHNIGSVQKPSTVTGEDNATNNNKNQYNIYVTAGDYVLGDPRELSGDELDGIDELSNYRKTRTDAVDVIAPSFKIASSYGKTLEVSYDNAVRRCASYQENGYPAGRWRIPTPAEIEFIVTRSTNKDIPSLFDGGYWAADKRYYSSSDNEFHEGTNTRYVRCVYDVWYWGEDKVQSALNSPVWGDIKTTAELNGN